MLGIFAVALSWILGALYLHWFRRNQYSKNPISWNQRGVGFIAFSDRQYWWLMTFWPVPIVGALALILLWWVCAAIEWLAEQVKGLTGR